MPLSKKEERILKSIVVASQNNPRRPEFPPDNPQFPATPTRRIAVPGFSQVWLKDESVNPTGTHKDRMAWEMVVTYRDFLQSKKEGRLKKIPELSILSSGSAALAIQSMFKKYGLPSIRVLMDSGADLLTVNKLKELGCRLFFTHLGKRILHWEDILRLTRNSDGFDITSNEAFDPTIRFYDWMSYEIINSNAEYIFVPFGTGQLYENIMNIVKQELSYKRRDPRFRGSKNILRNTSILGATTTSHMSKAVKLYAPFLPYSHCSQQWIKFYRSTGQTGLLSNVYAIQETFLDRALMFARSHGIRSEPSGIAGLALLLQMKNKIPKGKKILIVNTGKTI
ncbi:PLP-dependent lyase/thiolase [Candidatus Uhrbacteria bacterium]|nr:PLP-dependent lyase/thiolase [Candidatus Uhrbacteria bacterium]